MRVEVIDPSAYTPPYDHALCSALAAAGAEVRLLTSRFPYGPVPASDGYARRELFYARAHASSAAKARSQARLALKLAEHLPGMLRCRKLVADADIVHYQWLPIQQLDAHLLPRRRGPAQRPRLVITAHDVLPREPRQGQLRGQRLLYRRFDAIVVHSHHGARRLTGELGIEPQKVHVIRHGAFAHLAALPVGPPPFDRPTAAAPWSGPTAAPFDRPTAAAPWSGPTAAPFGSSTAAAPCGGPTSAQPFDSSTAAAGGDTGERRAAVVLCFGLMRPYKGLDVLLAAWRRLGEQAREGAQLWLAGMPRMDISGLDSDQRGVRLAPRFITDAELPSYFAHADLVVLPYREIDQSGVLLTALAFGKPLLLSDVGGFPEIAATGAARIVPAGDADALAGALGQLLADPAERARMAAAARAAAAGPYSWKEVASAHLQLYERLLGAPLGENGAATCAPPLKSPSGPAPG